MNRNGTRAGVGGTQQELVDALTDLADASSGEEAARIGDEIKARLGDTAPEVDALIGLLARRAGELDTLRKLAGSDELTGLANRRIFYDAVRRAQAEWARKGVGYAVIMFDLDDLKVLNDMHGHAIGDEALRAMARACLGTRRDTDLVARIGGDEFAVLLAHTDAAGALTAAERYRLEVQNCSVRGHYLQVSTGVGFPGEGRTTAEQVIDAADRRMYADKRRRKCGVFTSPSDPTGLAA